MSKRVATTQPLHYSVVGAPLKRRADIAARADEGFAFRPLNHAGATLREISVRTKTGQYGANFLNVEPAWLKKRVAFFRAARKNAPYRKV